MSEGRRSCGQKTKNRQPSIYTFLYVGVNSHILVLPISKHHIKQMLAAVHFMLELYRPLRLKYSSLFVSSITVACQLLIHLCDYFMTRNDSVP